MAFACDGGTVWRIDGDSKRRLGEQEYQEVIDSDGDKRIRRVTRLETDDAKWTTDLGGRIMQRSADGRLTQIGWVGWRRITTPDNSHVALLMTKSMDADARWAGRHDGKLYRDQ
jgi:hypothetical protein